MFIKTIVILISIINMTDMSYFKNLASKIQYKGANCKIHFSLKPVLDFLNLAQKRTIKVSLIDKKNDEFGYMPLSSMKNFKKYPKSSSIDKLMKKKINSKSYSIVSNHIFDTLYIMTKNFIQKETLQIQNINLMSDSILSKSKYLESKKLVFKLLKNLNKNGYIKKNKIKKIKETLVNYDNQFEKRFFGKHTSNSPFIMLLTLKNKLNKI